MKGKSVVLYLSYQTLITFTESDLGLPQFTFPSEIFLHGEVIDLKGFQAQITEYFTQIGLTNKTVLCVLAPDLVFTAQLESKNPTLADHLNTFVSAIPLEKNEVVLLKHQEKQNLSFYAANQKTYSTLVNLLEAQKNIVEAVVPAMMFPELDSGKTMTAAAVHQILHQRKIIDTYNFLKKNTSADELLVPAKRSNWPVVLLLVMVMVLMATGLGAGGFLWLKKNPTAWSKMLPQATVTPIQTNK